jgi:ActR/RegA family two-component response regulator/two-component sensor histidine kinase
VSSEAPGRDHREEGREDASPAIRFASLADLAAGIAHEINNPLAIILEAAGWIGDLLGEEGSPSGDSVEEVRRALRQITTQGERCRDITRNLLTFARPGSGPLQELDLNGLVAEVVEPIRRRAQPKGVEIAVHADPSLPAARLSAAEMQQLLTNLLTNAVDALQPDGGRVEVSTRLAGDEVELSVSDTGPGIPDRVLPRIFEPFFTTKPVGKGTGLGLAVCAGIVAGLGGSIGVETAPGCGATFRVRLPLTPAAPGLRPPPLAGPPPEEAPPVSMRPAAVLIVDDEAEFARTLSRRLERRGMQVATAREREAALAALSAARIDVVLLSTELRGGFGLALLEELRRAQPGVEVILLAAHGSAETAIEALKLGAFDYLLKPCPAAQLVERIEQARARKQRREQQELEARILDITSRRV